VLQKRFGNSEDQENGQIVAAAETARSAAESSAGKPGEKKDEEKMSLFWRVFGGTILSIAALVGITLFNNIYSNIGDLRAELNREREARAELVRKDEFNTRNTSVYDRIRALDGLKADMEGLRERVTANGSALDGLKKDSAATLDAAKKEVGAIADGVKKDAASLEVLKERVANLEAVKKDIAGLDLLKERLVAAAADLKSLRDDVTKVQQEVERNRAGDMERKNSRDTQFKQVDETIKELQKGLQDCREKLARLEGMQPAAGYGPAARPASPNAKPWFPVEMPLQPVPPGESKGSGVGTGAGSAKPPSTGSGNPATSKPGPGGEQD
jgi:archaellum component FlaC